MAYEAKEGDVSIFKNSKKTEDKHPDYTGKALIKGETMYLSLWLKQREGSEVFFSGRIEPRRETPVADPFNPKTDKPQAQPTDDLPF